MNYQFEFNKVIINIKIRVLQIFLLSWPVENRMTFVNDTRHNSGHLHKK